MSKEINPIKSNATLKLQKFSKDFKLNAVKLLKAGQTPTTQLALSLGIRRNLLYKWAKPWLRMMAISIRPLMALATTSWASHRIRSKLRTNGLNVNWRA